MACHCKDEGLIIPACPEGQQELATNIIILGFSLTAAYTAMTRYINPIIDAYVPNYKEIGLVSTAAFLTTVYIYSSTNYSDISYKPVSIDKTMYDSLRAIEPSGYIQGNSGENNLLKALDTGSYMFGKDQINFFYGGKGIDHFGFSMCSTKVINNSVSEIKNFETGKDIINIFCTKDTVKKEYISIEKKIINSNTYNFITIKMPTGEPSVLAVAGDITESDIQIITKGEWDNLAGSFSTCNSHKDFDF